VKRAEKTKEGKKDRKSQEKKSSSNSLAPVLAP
jgi:hypothetical protein